MQLAEEVSFEIHYRKFGEVKFPKSYSEIFWQNFPRFFPQKVTNNDGWNRATEHMSNSIKMEDENAKRFIVLSGELFYPEKDFEKLYSGFAQ